MGRDALPLGGMTPNIKACELPNGRFEARPECRDMFGNKHRPRGRGRTPAEAIRDAQKKAMALSKIGAGTGGEWRPTTKIRLALDMWLAEEQIKGRLEKSTLDKYEGEFDRATGKNADPSAIKLKPTIGNLSLQEATTPVMNRYMLLIMKRYTSKAQMQWAILSGMFGMAVRMGAVTTNPMDNTAKPERKDDEPDALSHMVFEAFMEQVAAWCRGEDIPGTPGWRSGPKRDERIYWIVVLFLETGVRPGELLAFRKEDFEPDADVPGIWVRGKLAYFGAGQGWRWKKGTKTGPKGVRRLALAPRGVEAVQKLLACGIVSDDDLVIPSPKGKGWNPNNFGETWRAVRGDTFTDITPTQIRHRVGTDVRQSRGIEAAAEQLGNSPTVAAKHYAARNREVDNRDAIGPKR